MDKDNEVKKPKGLKAYADFEFMNKAYKVGDTFSPPGGVESDSAHDDFLRAQSKKTGRVYGRSFFVSLPPVNKDDDPKTIWYILPVE